jgi:ABC-type sugar transport system ATPase subunit
MNFISGEVVQALPDKNAITVSTAFSENLLCTASKTTEVTSQKKVYASIRPEDVEIFSEPPDNRENLFKGTIAHKAYLGNFLYVFVSVDGNMIRAQISHHLPQKEGDALYLYLNPQKCMILS